MQPDDRWTEELGYTDLGTEPREETIGNIKRLIRDLNQRHPEIFTDEPITPGEYQRELKDAVFSLGGVLRQEHGADNEDAVQQAFLEPAQEAGNLRYQDQRGGERIDFKGRLTETGDRWAMDVKGGEGQSIGHLLVPDNTDFLVVWSERNARNTKSPSSRLNEVINRAVRWGFNQDEDVAMMVIRDPPAGARTDAGNVIPDVVVFPEHFPTVDSPDPPMRDLDDLHFASVLYETLVGNGDLDSEQIEKHLWLHDLNLEDTSTGYQINKEIRNAYDPAITLQTQSIDYERISAVE